MEMNTFGTTHEEAQDEHEVLFFFCYGNQLSKTATFLLCGHMPAHAGPKPHAMCDIMPLVMDST